MRSEIGIYLLNCQKSAIRYIINTESIRNWLILGKEKTPQIANPANCETK